MLAVVVTVSLDNIAEALDSKPPKVKLSKKDLVAIGTFY
jgi:hypothetical protein